MILQRTNKIIYGKIYGKIRNFDPKDVYLYIYGKIYDQSLIVRYESQYDYGGLF